MTSSGIRPLHSDPYAVAWAIPEDDGPPADERVVIDLTRATCADEHGLHCPACGDRGIYAVEMPDGERYHHCPTCSRLWTGEASDLHLVVGAVVTNRRRA